jgi:aminoglycoside phosphotransferase
MAHDTILEDLKSLHDQKVHDAPFLRQRGEPIEIEIDTLKHAIVEIERLRAAVLANK